MVRDAYTKLMYPEYIRMMARRMAMHACQIVPTDTTPPCLGSPRGVCIRTNGERFEAGNLSAPISALFTGVCRRCDYTLPFRFLAEMLVAARWLWSTLKLTSLVRMGFKILEDSILSIYYRYLIQGTSAWSRYMLNFVFQKN